MQRLSAFVLSVSLAIGIQGSALAAKAPKPPKGPKSTVETLQEQQDAMIRECKLSDQQQKTLKEKFLLKRKALETWEQANAAKVTAAEEAVKTARKGADAAAKKKANDDVKALMQDRVQATSETDKAILEVLTAEQQIVWAGFQMAETTLPRYKKASLTDDQTAKVKACCMIAAKDMAAFSGDDRKGKREQATVQKCLKWAIDNVILTPDQREIVVKKPKSK
jgi:hypothetical protein